MTSLLPYFETQRQNMIDLLTEMVNIESPSHDKARVDAFGTFMRGQFEALQCDSIEVFPLDDVGDCILAKWNAGSPGKPILFLGHMDTVWPVGTLAERPVRIDEDGRLYGPGAVDMKGGLTIALTAIRGLIQRDELPDRPIWMLLTGDEEIGSKHSRTVIQDVAAQCGLVLVLEPGTREGALKTRRKGVSSYRIYVQGRASHAGNAPEEGINAIIELAQQMLRLHDLNDLRNGTSVSVTMVEGGSAGNVIPASASAFVDTRVITQIEMDRIRETLEDLYPLAPGAELRIENVHVRPPMEHNALMQATFAQCRTIGAAEGITVREDSVGGGSDGNITASIGIATLDGLGPQGDGLHALHEHVIINSLPQRAALCAAMLRDWVL